MTELASMAYLMSRIGCMDGKALTESTRRRRELLVEDSRMDALKKIIRTEFNPLVRDVDQPSWNPDCWLDGDRSTTWMTYFIWSIRHTLGLMENSDTVLLPQAARIAFGELDFEKTNDHDLRKMHKLRKYLQLIKKDPEAKKWFAQERPDFDQVSARYQPYFDEQDAQMFARMKEAEPGYKADERYDIIPIKSPSEAWKYARYSGVDGEKPLCFAEKPEVWPGYANHGRNACYLCLRRDWREVPCEEGPGYPKDDYGLSMIFLFVDPSGRISNSNVRWNHCKGDDVDIDNMFTEEEISELVGRPWHSTFRPLGK